mmetsp:Transcript_31178/g.74031  ORF Transcript_31178/g.74031 Transcript_31178/m.74031 type:complete len:210 (+) Transcript_31178:97-726(+)|eukprot:CAMPEP_0180148094 /NCGR_PEP_ID=MMETSP0986-20121125/19746_1 /TAXON_ID=697907 /ORGANISM="non described non described, Strain CCMP2293" /LENGTH=209 /DNA_ID=CAMNT_0022093967 /DNA_START=83 /DNA_END=712 /DNA_ORIENTATION=-
MTRLAAALVLSAAAAVDAFSPAALPSGMITLRSSAVVGSSVTPARSARRSAVDVSMSVEGERVSRRNLGLLSLGLAAVVASKPSAATAETSTAVPLFPLENSFLSRPPPQMPEFDPTPSKLPWEGRAAAETAGPPPSASDLKEVIAELKAFKEKIRGDAFAVAEKIGSDTKNPIPRAQTEKALLTEPNVLYIDKALAQLAKQLTALGAK